MADTTKIEWTATRLADGTLLPGYTFNPWTGCTKVSPGCDHCYAEGWSKRSGHVEWGPHGSRRRTSAANWAKPIKWNAEAEATGIRRKVFCASLADVFDNHASITSGWRGDLWHLIYRTPHLDWLLLTKRPQNIAKMLPEGYGAPAWGDGWKNVWLGTTAENQVEWDRRWPVLEKIPAVIRFISAEPLVSDIQMNGNSKPDWLIVGGESGPGARPMHPDWPRSLRDQCRAAGVDFFFKQWGQWAPIDGQMDVARGDVLDIDNGVIRVGKARAGRLLDGREWNEFQGGADV